ncbi:peptidoglycan-binding domain-containing protein [Streptomyces mirabilis]|uniref:peptidoglycan-binding domain-containing protein n=1 Tax=Streptomyces mirabilis TaxID=68239 RepID=UPI0036DE3DA4
MHIKRKAAVLVTVATLLAGFGGTAMATATSASAATYTCSGRQTYLYNQYNQHWGGYFNYAEYQYNDTVTYVPTYNDYSTQTIEAQCLLKDVGYSLTVDGIYGANTKAAVEAFQNTHKNDIWRLTADGYLGPATWPILRSDASD